MRISINFLFAVLTASLILAGGEDPLAIGARPVTAEDVSRSIARLNDADDAVAIAAAQALGASKRPEALKRLIDFYQNSNAARRLAATAAIAALELPERKPIAAQLERIALGDASQAVRTLAVHEWAKLSGPNEALKPISAFVLDAKNPTVFRARAIFLAAQAGQRLASPLLRGQLDSPDVDVAAAAIDELAELRDVTSVDALLKILETGREELKAAAAVGLAKLSGKKFGFDLLKWNEWRKEVSAEATSGALPEITAEPYPAEREKTKPVEKLPVDLVIAFDATGSFLHVWADVNRALDAVLRELVKNEPSVRIGLVRYRSLDPRATLKYTLKISPLTYNTDAIRKDLSLASFGGGSGALHEGMRAAINHMVWRARARKVVLIIGDDSPFSPAENGLQTAVNVTHDAGAVDGIVVNTLFCRTTAGDENRVTYRYIADAGIGRFYEYNKAEKHLVDMSAEKIDVKQVEMPAETAKKWVEARPPAKKIEKKN